MRAERWTTLGVGAWADPPCRGIVTGGGTHVENTREVGGIRVTGYESKGRINKRIRIELVDPIGEA